MLEGDTLVVPFTGLSPILLSRFTELALVVIQLKVVLPPRMTVSGAAVNAMVGGNTTFTLAVAGAAGPPGPLAVAV